MNNRRTRWAIGTVLFVVFIDQALKIWVKTTMTLGEEIHLLGNWAKLHFTEYEAMCTPIYDGLLQYHSFLGSLLGLLFVGYYLYRLFKQQARLRFIVSSTVVFAGILSNTIDKMIYGVLFSWNTPHSVAEIVGFSGESYASFFLGKVVYMLYFPIWRGQFPDNFPIWAGEYFIFLRPVFNIADIAFYIGLVSFFVFKILEFIYPNKLF